MDSNTAFILSQVLVVVGYFFNCLSFFIKTRGKLMVVCSGTSVFMALSLVFLNAWAGAVCQVLGLARNIVFYFTQKNQTQKYRISDYVWLAIFMVAIFVGGLLTYDMWFSLMPIISTLVYTYAVWQRNTSYFKYFVFYSSLTMIIYYIFIWSPFGLILEILSFIAIILSIIKQVHEILKQHRQSVILSSDTEQQKQAQNCQLNAVNNTQEKPDPIQPLVTKQKATQTRKRKKFSTKTIEKPKKDSKNKTKSARIKNKTNEK